MKKTILLLSVMTVAFTGKVTAQTYSVGDFYSKDGVQGVVFKTDGKHGKVVSLDEYRGEWTTTIFSDVKTSNSTDGQKNMAQVKKQDNWRTKFPVFAWSDNHNNAANDKQKWYLPAVEELDDLRIAISKVNPTLKEHGKEMNTSFLYWSSTTSDVEEAAWCLWLKDGNIGAIPKQSISYPIQGVQYLCTARCIMEF